MGGQGGVSDDLGDLTARLNIDTSAASAALTDFAGGFPLIGAAVAAAGVAVAGIGVASTKMAADFQQSLTMVRTQAGDTTDSIGQLGDQLMALAPQVGQTPEALAKAFFHLASAGYTGAQGLDILRQSAELADVGQSDLEATTKAVIGALKSSIPGIKDAADAVGVLNAIVGSGDMHMQDLVDAMGSGLLPVAATFGVSMQSVGAALSFMTDQQVPAADAATRLKMSIALIAAPTAQAAKLLGDAGLSAKDAADQTSAMQDALEKAHVTTTMLAADLRQPDGLVAALRDLKQHMTDAGVSAPEQAATIARAFGGGRSGSALISLFNNLDAVKTKFDDINQHAGQFAQSWATQQQTATQRLADFHAALDVVGIKIGNLILPAATAGLAALTTIITNLTSQGGALEPVLGRLGSVFGEVGQWVEKHVLPVLEQLGKFIETKVLPVFGELVGFFEQHTVPMFERAADAVGKTLVPALENVWTVFSTQLLPVLMDVAGWFDDHVVPVLITLAQVVIPPLVTVLGDTATGLVGILKALYGAASNFTNWVSQHWPELIPVFALVTAALTPMIAAFVAAQAAAAIAAVQMGLSYAAFVAGAILTNAALVADAVGTSAATSAQWIVSAAKAAGAWAVWEAGVIGTFVITVASAVEQAALAAGAWIVQAARAAAAWIGDFVAQMAGAGGAVVATAGTEAAITAGEWSGAADGAAGAWGGAYASIEGGAAAAAASVAASMAIIGGAIAVALQALHNFITDFKNSPLGQHTGLNPLPPSSDWRNDLPGPLGFASGGILPPGMWGQVNEIGPEPIFASPSGAVIVPHGSVTPLDVDAAGGTVNYITINVAQTQATAADIGRELGWALK
ncbi:MAG: phage tail tape measure protein [Candidatus Dormibacteria bacterium]